MHCNSVQNTAPLHMHGAYFVPLSHHHPSPPFHPSLLSNNSNPHPHPHHHWNETTSPQNRKGKYVKVFWHYSCRASAVRSSSIPCQNRCSGRREKNVRHVQQSRQLFVTVQLAIYLSNCLSAYLTACLPSCLSSCLLDKLERRQELFTPLISLYRYYHLHENNSDVDYCYRSQYICLEIIFSLLYEQHALSRSAETAAAITSATAQRSTADQMQFAELSRILGKRREEEEREREEMKWKAEKRRGGRERKWRRGEVEREFEEKGSEEVGREREVERGMEKEGKERRRGNDFLYLSYSTSIDHTLSNHWIDSTWSFSWLLLHSTT